VKISNIMENAPFISLIFLSNSVAIHYTPSSLRRIGFGNEKWATAVMVRMVRGISYLSLMNYWEDLFDNRTGEGGGVVFKALKACITRIVETYLLSIR